MQPGPQALMHTLTIKIIVTILLVGIGSLVLREIAPVV